MEPILEKTVMEEEESVTKQRKMMTKGDKNMVDFEKGYIPFFFKWTELTDDFSDAEFGGLVRDLCRYFKDGTAPTSQNPRQRTAFVFMLDAAERVVEYQKTASERGKQNANNRWKKPEKKPEHIDFDVDAEGNK